MENRDFPSGPVVKTLPFNAEGVGSIPSWATEVPYAMECSQKSTKQTKSTLTFSPKCFLSYHLVPSLITSPLPNSKLKALVYIQINSRWRDLNIKLFDISIRKKKKENLIIKEWEGRNRTHKQNKK